MKKRTVTEMLDEAVERWPLAPYALKKADDGYKASSFTEIRDMAKAFSAWLLSSGFEPGDNVAIFGEGSPEWMAGEFGLFYAGLVSVPLSTKLTPDELFFRLDHSEAKAILTTHSQLETVLKIIAARMTKPLSIVYLDEDSAWGRGIAEGFGMGKERFAGFAEAVEAGRKALAAPAAAIASRLEAIAASIAEDSVASISYTSGTTGNPKGIMLTHLNFWANSHDLSIRFITPRFRTLLILPADHAFIHTSAIFTALWSGVALYFVDTRGGGMALLRNIPANIQECQPTFLFTVPALTINFMKKIIAGVEQKGPFAAKLFEAGMNAASKWMGDGCHRPPLGDRISAFFPYFTAKTLLFGKIRKKALGGSISFCISGGSKLDTKQQKFFTALGVPLLPGYGLTEASPVVSASTLARYKFGTVGILLPSVTSAIVDEDGTELPTGRIGEITVAGDSVMKGYYKNQEATADVIKNGRLWTGDLGYMDEDGFLVVVGRKRALLIAESGEKYSPETIEDAVMTSTNVVEQVMVWCVYKKHPCALVTLDVPRIKTIIAEKRITTAEALCKVLQDEFYRFMNGSSPQSIQSNWVPITFQIIGKQLNEQDGMINSTLKLVRHKVEAEYRELIDYSYTKEGSTTLNPRNIETLTSLFGL
ncbi:MAG TPA: AMP-binding protein [Rectinemataceae bacterium]|nr:AMP-binding protein [Rectinemataceae bacterium]